GRDSVIAEMKKRLLAGGSHALLGPRHTGKRAIALELVYDEELRQAYPDGVLWSDLREEGSAGAELASWADALGISRNTISALKRPQDRAVAVAQSIGQRRMLLVATECGLPAEAILFQLAGPNCAHLL